MRPLILVHCHVNGLSLTPALHPLHVVRHPLEATAPTPQNSLANGSILAESSAVPTVDRIGEEDEDAATGANPASLLAKVRSHDGLGRVVVGVRWPHLHAPN